MSGFFKPGDDIYIDGKGIERVPIKCKPNSSVKGGNLQQVNGNFLAEGEIKGRGRRSTLGI